MVNNQQMPLLQLRDIVVFPNMVVPLFVGRDKSIQALNEAMKNDKKIILVSQKNSEIDDPETDDIFSYGCESTILQLLKLPDGTVKVLAEGINRVKVLNITNNKNKGKFELPIVGTHDALSKISVPPVEAIPSLFHGPIIRKITIPDATKSNPKPLKIS